MLLGIQCLVTEVAALEAFREYVKEQAKADDTWLNFVLKDCFGYVCLFFAIRSLSWDLCMSGLKNMCDLFCVYDRPLLGLGICDCGTRLVMWVSFYCTFCYAHDIQG